jgi:ribosomal protein S18 acetylase RimI-like enzyme
MRARHEWKPRLGAESPLSFRAARIAAFSEIRSRSPATHSTLSVLLVMVPPIRRAQERDVTRVIELYAELDLHHRDAHPEFYATEYAPRDTAWVKETLADPKAGFFVSEPMPGEISGFARILEIQTPVGRVLASRHFGLLDELVVARSARRQGTGTALLVACEDWARERGLPAIEVTVWAFNDAARELYENREFQVIRHYYRKQLG